LDPKGGSLPAILELNFARRLDEFLSVDAADCRENNFFFFRSGFAAGLSEVFAVPFLSSPNCFKGGFRGHLKYGNLNLFFISPRSAKNEKQEIGVSLIIRSDDLLLLCRCLAYKQPTFPI
jgi:hypothetical protein